MISNETVRMIQEYVEEASAPMFLSGFFRSPPRNFHSSEKVTLDVQRDDEDIAIPVPNVSSGARHNENSLYTNKGFTPPVLKESGAINAFKLLKRKAGRDPFEDPAFVRDAREEVFIGARKLERKIRRTVELMSSQILANQAISLVDSAGNVLYSESFAPKATHLATTSTTWATNGSAGTPLADLEALAVVVRRDGKSQPKHLVFGGSAFQRFLANADVRARLDNRNMELGQVAPRTRGEGATFQGYVWIGSYRFEMWTYDGFYRHPQTGNLTPYVDTDHVLMLSENGRLDLTYGDIPKLRAPEAAAANFLPSRVSAPDAGLDLIMNAWFSPDGENLFYSVASRPLPIATAPDTIARLDVTT